MNNDVKRFIEENINLIEEDKWEEVYGKAGSELRRESDTGKFTEIMLKVDLHPESYLKELPNYFLSGCNLSKFEIPNHIASIGSYAFRRCENLTDIVIPDSVTSIGKSAFDYCSNLRRVVVGDGVTSIDESAFYLCKSLTNIVIPDNVRSIGERAFYSCRSLISIVIPSTVISIGDHAFTNCQDNLIIDYTGTKREWKKIYNKTAFYNISFTVNCTDGSIIKSKR